MIWIGAGLSVLGITMLVRCILLAMRAKAQGGSDAEIRARLQRVVALNLGAIAISGFGLICVVVGVILSP